MPFYPKMLQVKEHIQALSSLDVFIFKLAFDSYEKFGVHQHMYKTTFDLTK